MRLSRVAIAGLHLSVALADDIGIEGHEQVPLGVDRLGPIGRGKGKPNIVFILTDDQDLHLQSLDYLPLIKKHLVDQGTFYKRHYCTTAICCPSRVSLWTGKLAHNTNVTDVSPPYGTAFPSLPPIWCPLLSITLCFSVRLEKPSLTI